MQYGLKKLSLPVEELLIDVYYHFFHDIQTTAYEETAADHIEHERSIGTRRGLFDLGHISVEKKYILGKKNFT